MDTYRHERIREIPPTPGTAIDQVFTPADYRDCFLVETGDRYPTVADFASAYFLNQPRWLSLLSMNLASRKKLKAAIADANGYQVDTAIGSWKVYNRTEEEIVFGDNMGFMEYRFSFRLDGAGFVEASTAVKYSWGGTGRFYFALVKPMHKRFVPISLRAACTSMA
ncbi:MAG: DUF2867 domain-containing protein [Acidimicrobiales bacterium]